MRAISRHAKARAIDMTAGSRRRQTTQVPWPLLLTTAKARQRLGVSERGLRDLLKRGLPYIMVGRRRMFPANDMADWISEQAIRARRTSRSPARNIGFAEAVAYAEMKRARASRAAIRPDGRALVTRADVYARTGWSPTSSRESSGKTPRSRLSALAAACSLPSNNSRLSSPERSPGNRNWIARGQDERGVRYEIDHRGPNETRIAFVQLPVGLSHHRNQSRINAATVTAISRA
jgi:hypothetical protein